MRVAMVTRKFPVTSQHFVLQQVEKLLEAGVDLSIFGVRPDEAADLHGALDSERLASRVHYRPNDPPGAVGRWTGLLGFLATFPPPLWYESLAGVALSVRRGLEEPSAAGYYTPQVAREGPFDVIHCQFGVAGRQMAPFCARHPHPKLVTTFHGFAANVLPSKKKPNYYDLLFEVGDVFTVNSEFLAGRLRELGCPAAKIEILPMPVDLDNFDFAERRREPGEPVRLLSVGRLVEAKGIDVAIRAVGLLVEQGCDVRYRVVGGGDARARLQERVDELGLGDRVEFLGAQPHEAVRQAYLDAHLFVFPSVVSERGDEETQGIVVQEAQATGLPVVASEVGGVAEGLLDGESGVCCAPDSPEQLAECIEELIEAEERWPRMGRAGRAFVEEHYTVEEHIRRLLEVYRT